MLLPDRSPLRPVDAPEVQLAAVSDVQEDPIAPDDGSRAGPGRHCQLPGDVLVLRPAYGKVLLAADAVHRRTAPLGPVLGGWYRANTAEQGDRQSYSRWHWISHLPSITCCLTS